MRVGIEAASERIRQGGIVAIVRGVFESNAVVEIGEVLLSEGVTTMEVTLNSPGAAGHIGALKAALGQKMLIGAGTVRQVSQVAHAVAAGAEFLVSPSLDLDVVAASWKAEVLQLPGVLTPTEVEAAVKAGCSLVKLFPADTFGVAYLKALRAPLDDVGFMPTGGVTVANIGEWKRVGAVAVACGSTLVAGTLDEVRLKARGMVSGWRAG